MTFSTVYAWSENYVLPISHDEVVHGKGSFVGKMPGDMWRKLANARALLAFQWAHPGKQLLFMGSELGDLQEWSESRGLNWDLLLDPAQAGLQRLVRDLNVAYRNAPALWSQDTTPDGFRWLSTDDAAHNFFAFMRLGSDGSHLVCLLNLSAVPLELHRVGLPAAGDWAEVINTDADLYGGSGVGNLGTVHAEAKPFNGQPASAQLRVPPLGGLWLKYSASA
jgi:1,4-alpha-glucan branching enzyme